MISDSDSAQAHSDNDETAWAAQSPEVVSFDDGQISVDEALRLEEQSEVRLLNETQRQRIDEAKTALGELKEHREGDSGGQ